MGLSRQSPEQEVITDSAAQGGDSSSGQSGGGMLGMFGMLGNGAMQDILRTSGIGQPLMAPMGVLGGAAEWLGGAVRDSGIGQPLMGSPGVLGGAAEWIGNKAGELGSWAGDRWNDVKEGAGSLWDSAASTAGNLWDSATGWLGNAADGVKQFGSDLWNGVSQEGLGGVLDPVGMMDRQAAQRELADRFTIVGDDHQGVRAPNAVTQAEYERICRMYSDIRLGRGDLTIDPSALGTDAERDAYRQGAMGDIASMLQTESGRAIITQLHNNAPQNDADGNPIHRHTTMVPLLASDGTLDRTNGYAAPDGPGSMRSVNADGTLGAAGTGTDVHIRYNPGVNIGDAYPGLQGNNPWLGQMRSDVLLAHEMNHAIMQTSGMGDPRAVQATDNAANATDPDMAWDAAFRDQHGNPLTRIEHQAVGLGLYSGGNMTENAYRAERRRMADMGAVGTRTGDDTMVQRTTYVPRNAPAAAPPGTGTPALPPVLIGHGPHDHDHDHAH